MSSRARSLVVFGLKAAVATILIGWLVQSGTLDFKKLGILFSKPYLLAMDLGVFAVGAIIGTLRWRALLGLADVHMPFRRLLQLQLVALFFNVVIPGNVGGDVVKALYVARDNDPSKRTTILLIVFIERLMGLAGLVTMATLVTAARGPALFSDPQLRPTAALVGLLGVCTVLGPAAFFAVLRRHGDRIEAWTGGTTRFAKLASQLIAAMRLLASGPRGLFTALGLSMCLHAVAMGYFTVLTRVVGGYDVSYAAIATIFPLGLLTLILPISPSGLGVGHVAFDRLFVTIGLVGGGSGATVFNIYLLGQIAPCLFGVFPYLGLRKQPALQEAE